MYNSFHLFLCHRGSPQPVAPYVWFGTVLHQKLSWHSFLAAKQRFNHYNTGGGKKKINKQTHKLKNPHRKLFTIVNIVKWKPFDSSGVVGGYVLKKPSEKIILEYGIIHKPYYTDTIFLMHVCVHFSYC